jgi:hypothetical protein
MKRLLAVTLLTLAVVVPAHAAEGDSPLKVVLVANQSFPSDDVSLLVVRKVFLGISTRVAGVALEGLRNTSDAQLNAIFLQTVVAMSEHSYDRRLLTQALQSGVPLPPEVDDDTVLAHLIGRNRGAMSYMWYHDAIKYPSIKILRVIWQSE